MDVRKMLTDHFASQAQWRWGKAEAHPEDERNEQSAAALLALAEFVTGLPEDDARLKRVANLQRSYGLDVVVLGEEAKRLVEGYGFGREEDLDIFLSQLVEVIAEETPDADIDPWAAVEAVGSDDPTLSLSAIGSLREWLEFQEEDAVLKARVELMSWAQIGRLLGRSKQAVWEKHRDPQDGDPDDKVWIVPGA